MCWFWKLVFCWCMKEQLQIAKLSWLYPDTPGTILKEFMEEVRKQNGKEKAVEGTGDPNGRAGVRDGSARARSWGTRMETWTVLLCQPQNKGRGTRGCIRVFFSQLSGRIYKFQGPWLKHKVGDYLVLLCLSPSPLKSWILPPSSRVGESVT